MLLNINTTTRYAEKCRTERLQTFGLDERGLQDILYRTLDRLFPDDELILLMQSRQWQEEPDLMAIDRDGNLFIFELKAWESNSLNLLQVLRYGQIFGSWKYTELDALYKKATAQSESLKGAHNDKFGTNLPEEKFNSRQVFVVMTNGLDYRTREAIQYWRSCNLDVRPWVYRVYAGGTNTMQLEISAFRVQDNPYEDIAEGYYILNTNFGNNPEAHMDMLSNAKAAAYYEPWKFKIERLQKGDIVFLYQSGVGIVAIGEPDGKLCKGTYEGNIDEEYFMKLQRFQKLSKPLTAAEMKAKIGLSYVFMQTMFGVDAEDGKRIRKYLYDDGRLER